MKWVVYSAAVHWVPCARHTASKTPSWHSKAQEWQMKEWQMDKALHLKSKPLRMRFSKVSSRFVSPISTAPWHYTVDTHYTLDTQDMRSKT